MNSKSKPVAWRWPNNGKDKWLNRFIYIDGGAPDYPEDCEALFVHPSNERANALREILALCERALIENDQTLAQLDSTEFMEQLIIQGAKRQASNMRDRIRELLKATEQATVEATK